MEFFQLEYNIRSNIKIVLPKKLPMSKLDKFRISKINFAGIVSTNMMDNDENRFRFLNVFVSRYIQEREFVLKEIRNLR